MEGVERPPKETRSSTASKLCSTAFPTASSPSTSSARSASIDRRELLVGEGQTPAPAGQLPQDRRCPPVPRLYSVADDLLFGTVREKKGAANTLAALQQIRAQRPDNKTIYVILDNLSARRHERAGERSPGVRSSGARCSSPRGASGARTSAQSPPNGAELRRRRARPLEAAGGGKMVRPGRERAVVAADFVRDAVVATRGGLGFVAGS